MKRYCRGLTLVELMISLALSLMIMAGAISIFMGSKETFRLEGHISQVQENFRYIANRLTQDLSLVGFTGCSLPYLDNSSTVSNRVSGTSGVRDVIEGDEGGAGPDTLTFSYAMPAGGTNVLVGSGETVKSPINISTSTALYKALKANLAESEATQVPITLLVGNCDGGDIFVPTGLDENVANDPKSPPAGEAGIRHEKDISVGGLKNAEDSFNVAYGDQSLSAARVYYTQKVTYEICADAAEVTGLCVTRGGNEQLLMPGVTDFQVRYGLDSVGADGNADRYVDWSGTIDSPTITAIRVTLTMVLDQAGGSDVTKTYSFTVKLRNMGLI